MEPFSVSDQKLVLESLSDQAYAITPDATGFYKEQCMVCFHKNGHESGVMLEVRHHQTCTSFQICWTGKVTDRMISNAYVDHLKYVDFGACAVALLLIRRITDYKAVQQSAIGTTIDYYLAPQDQDDDLIFNHAARLEVAGILKENENNTVKDRIMKKRNRLKESSLPTYIIVIEFSRPWSEMVEI